MARLASKVTHLLYLPRRRQGSRTTRLADRTRLWREWNVNVSSPGLQNTLA